MCKIIIVYSNDFGHGGRYPLLRGCGLRLYAGTRTSRCLILKYLGCKKHELVDENLCPFTLSVPKRSAHERTKDLRLGHSEMIYHLKKPFSEAVAKAPVLPRMIDPAAVHKFEESLRTVAITWSTKIAAKLLSTASGMKEFLSHGAGLNDAEHDLLESFYSELFAHATGIEAMIPHFGTVGLFGVRVFAEIRNLLGSKLGLRCIEEIETMAMRQQIDALVRGAVMKILYARQLGDGWNAVGRGSMVRAPVTAISWVVVETKLPGSGKVLTDLVKVTAPQEDAPYNIKQMWSASARLPPTYCHRTVVIKDGATLEPKQVMMDAFKNYQEDIFDVAEVRLDVSKSWHGDLVGPFDRYESIDQVHYVYDNETHILYTRSTALQRYGRTKNMMKIEANSGKCPITFFIRYWPLCINA